MLMASGQGQITSDQEKKTNKKKNEKEKEESL